MLQFPKDITTQYASIGLRKPEMNAVTIPADGSFKGGDILQTCHCLELVLSGKLRVRFHDTLQDIAADDIQFRKRGNYQVEPSADYSAILFFIQDAFIIDFIKEIDHFAKKEVFAADLPPFLFKSSDFIKENMDHALKKIMNYEVFSPCIVKLTALQVLFQIFSKETTRTFADYLRYLVSGRKIDLSFFMETNFTQNMSLEEMAKLTGRSISSFKKEFATLFNSSPQKWIINRRLEQAHYLLQRSDEPITQIAYQCGFENISHFSRVYKLKYNTTPKSGRVERSTKCEVLSTK